MRLSYAQCLEDYHLDLVLGDRAQGFYVDVGGGHPVADNVSYHFYLKGWRGVVVEPQADLAALYDRLRPRDRVATHLVGRAEGEVPFHRVDRLHGFSTIVEANAKGAGAFGAGYETVSLPIRPLSVVLDEAGSPNVDFLKIDVEGAEADVLEGMDWTRHRPSVLCIEAIEPGSAREAWQGWEPIVIAAGYLHAFSDGLNRFYVAKEEEQLAARFPSSPTPWEAVKHFYEFGKVDARPDHPDRALAERLIRGFLASVSSMPETEILALLARSAGPNGMETGEALRALLIGTCDFPADGETALEHSESLNETVPFDDRVRAALGRISAQYDGGMLGED
jgi:FkbM family methyltransferase